MTVLADRSALLFLFGFQTAHPALVSTQGNQDHEEYQRNACRTIFIRSKRKEVKKGEGIKEATGWVPGAGEGKGSRGGEGEPGSPKGPSRTTSTWGNWGFRTSPAAFSLYPANPSEPVPRSNELGEGRRGLGLGPPWRPFRKAEKAHRPRLPYEVPKRAETGRQ